MPVSSKQYRNLVYLRNEEVSRLSLPPLLSIGLLQAGALARRDLAILEMLYIEGIF